MSLNLRLARGVWRKILRVYQTWDHIIIVKFRHMIYHSYLALDMTDPTAGGTTASVWAMILRGDGLNSNTRISLSRGSSRHARLPGP